ncbi:MAG: carboxypeptidase regulatory-like domain-containing protein [Terriglobia bacterium]
MNSRKVFCLFTVVAALSLLAACSKKTETTTEETTAPTEQAETPVDPSTVGEIAGTVKFDGEKPKPKAIMMDQDSVCVKKHNGPVYYEDGEVNANGTLANAFVYVKDGADKYSFPTPTDQVTLDQNGCMYQPHVLGIMVGQGLHVVSSDATTHNIHPMPTDNREWNQSQAPGAAPIDEKFTRREIMIPVKCNQHPWMKAYLGVMKNPLYAVTNADGTFTIKGVPPGDYTIGAWTATFGQQETKVTVPAKGSATADFTFKAGS